MERYGIIKKSKNIYLYRIQKKIQYKMLIVLIFSTITPVSIVGYYGIIAATNTLRDLALANLQKKMNDSSENIINNLENIGYDVLFLSKVPPIQGIVRARNNNKIDRQGSSTYEAWRERLSTIFIEFMQTKPYYMQLRYLDESGNEMVRVNSDGLIVKNIPEEELQNKAKREYFTETMTLDLG